MIYLKQKIKGLMLIKPEPFVDNRGFFRRIYCYKELNLKKIKFSIKQANISENKNIQTLRGFHYQKFPYGEDKIISCIQGEIHNIVIDMRKNSKTFMKWQSFRLSETNRFGLLVPKGCANAYLTLKKKIVNVSLYFEKKNKEIQELNQCMSELENNIERLTVALEKHVNADEVN